jgi:uncharacterized repeat protein (TIGR03803 family)
MKNNLSRFFQAALVAVVALVFTLTTTASAQYTETVLHNFANASTDGQGPATALIFDPAGNLYGTTSVALGGSGVAFELSPSASGWTETILYTFPLGRGNHPSPSSGLTRDASGNLYGVTFQGGTSNQGMVYELSPGSSGWTATTLYSFAGGSDGSNPSGNVIFDAAGNLYGTTSGVLDSGCGTVFKLSPGSGGWTETILYSFTCGADGSAPGGNIVFDSAGNLYGAASAGGDATSGCFAGCGTIFRLSPLSGGGWKFGRLFTFHGKVGGSAPLGVIADTAGNLYGPALGGGGGCGGTLGCGLVFKLTKPSQPGPWIESVLHPFTSKHDGSGPSGVILDSAGNIFGTASQGSAFNTGNVFKISPSSTGQWTFSVLYSFGNGSNGATPNGGVILDSSGNLYGTTLNGGSANAGTVFELSPSASKTGN